MDLDQKVFGNITKKEIIGSFPPAIPDTKKLLDEELQQLTDKLDSKNEESLKKLLEDQIIAQKLVNNRPGAMALAQDKIRLFTEYSTKYIQEINQTLESRK